MKFRKMSVPFAPKPGISRIFGRIESAHAFSSLEDALHLASTKNRTSGQVQHRKSAIHGLLVTLRMLRVKSDKFD